MPTVATERPKPLTDVEVSAFRRLPHNLDAERSLLGAIFVDNRAFERVIEFLRPEHFFLPHHGRVFETVGKVIERGQIADPVTLKGFFENDDVLADVGGVGYLYELAANAVAVINAGEYGRLIYDLYLKRQLIGLGHDMVNEAFSGEIEETAPRLIEVAEQRLYDLAATGEYEGGFRPFKESLTRALEMADAAFKRESSLSGVPTGFIAMDKLLGGLHRSDLIVLAGRPSMGKTALATNMAFNAAYTHARTKGQDGAVVGFFSLEMSAEQLAARIISESTNIGSDRMRKGELSRNEFARLATASQELLELPIFIDDSPALSVSQLRTRARRLKRQNKLGLIVVDYLQLMSAGAGSRHDNRMMEISEITRGLKTLAKELEVPVLALSQLSRAVEQREDKRPQLSDLRESGTIEQDSDVVMFIFRQQYYLERAEPQRRPEENDEKFVERRANWERNLEEVRNKAEVIVAKQRHGPTGKLDLSFMGEFTRFENLATSQDAPF